MSKLGIMRKPLIVFMSLLLVVLSVAMHTTSASANSTTENEMTPEEFKLAEIVSEHIVMGSEGQGLVVHNEEILEQKLVDNNLTHLTSVNEIKGQLDNSNEILANKMEMNNDGISTYSTCSNMLAVLGLTHVTSLSAAAIILGVTQPWLVFGIILGYGIIWTGGGFACK